MGGGDAHVVSKRGAFKMHIGAIEAPTANCWRWRCWGKCAHMLVDACLVLDTGSSIASVAPDVGLGESVVGRWVKLERERRQAAEQGALIHARWKLRSLLCGGGCASWRRRTSFWESQRLLRLWAPKHQRFELMDAQKASYSITLMGKVLGVTCAGYFPWKNRAPSGASAHWCGGVWMRRWPGNTRCRVAPMGLLASAML